MIKVLLVDDHKIVRDGIRALLSGQEDICVYNEAGSGSEMYRLLNADLPDIILMDI